MPFQRRLRCGRDCMDAEIAGLDIPRLRGQAPARGPLGRPRALVAHAAPPQADAKRAALRGDRTRAAPGRLAARARLRRLARRVPRAIRPAAARPRPSRGQPPRADPLRLPTLAALPILCCCPAYPATGSLPVAIGNG
jgi:hypothetical protein